MKKDADEQDGEERTTKVLSMLVQYPGEKSKLSHKWFGCKRYGFPGIKNHVKLLH